VSADEALFSHEGEDPMGMTQEQLTAHIENIVGAQVAKALAKLNERRQDEAVSVARVEEIVGRVPGDFKSRNLEADKRQKGAIAFGGALLCLAEARGQYERAVEISKGNVWKSMPEVNKVLEAGSGTAGGVMIAPEHSEEVIDLLAARATVRRHISDTMDVSSGMIDMPRLTADASTSWGGEIEPASEGQPAFDQLVMRAFQQKTLIPISNTLLRRGGARVSQIVRNSTLRSMALGEDRVFITSPGSEHRPKGLKFWAPESNRLTAQSFSLTHVNEDLGRLILTLEEANVPMTSPVWTFAPRTKQALMTLQTTTGSYAFRDEMTRGLLWGFPFDSTTHVVRNEGSGEDESRIYLWDADEFMIGQGLSLQVDLSSEASFVDADGNVVSAFQRNLTLLRVINEVDLKPKHAEAIATLNEVTWAPTSV
jgi:HK97 family phage major capsid protein